MPTVFLTGFPGFLGSALVERLLDRYPVDTAIVCLVQAKFRPLAQQRADVIESQSPSRVGRIQLVEGDITQPGLGLDAAAAWQADTVEIYHLAAVYDLGVKRDLAMRVNVDGTHHVLEFVAGCPNLKRFQYVSTCYVSGRHPGLFHESDLAKGQQFNNYYEETKYLAEVAVQEKMRRGLPTTIYRPSIVVGDSQSGATQKYDGAYYFIQLLARQKGMAIVPVVGNLKKHEFNIVPRDFVIDALTYLSGVEHSLGKVYHLSDPAAPTVERMLDIIAQATQRRVIRIPVWKGLAKGFVKYVPGANALLRVEPEAIDYYTHPTLYTCDNTLRDLKGTGIACPPFAHYAANLVEFYMKHPEFSPAAMV